MRQTHWIVKPPLRLLLTAAIGILFLFPSGALADDGDPEDGSQVTQVDESVPLPPKPKFPRLDSELNRMVEQIGPTAPQTIAISAPLYQGETIAVTVRLSHNVGGTTDLLEVSGATVANIGGDYIEAYLPVTLLPVLAELDGVLEVSSKSV